jgi:quaternary ammonium compound-resistance protein SugE
MNAWIVLLAAGLFEVAWVAGFKFLSPARPLLSLATIGAMIASFALLWVAMRTIPVGTAYAVWVGIGAAGAALIGVYAFKEPATLQRFLCIALIVGGVIGLKATSST